MTFSDNSSVHGAALTEENQADLLDIGLFLLDDPDFRQYGGEPSRGSRRRRRHC